MGDFDTFSAKPLGSGQLTVPGSLSNAELSSLLTNYKRTIASNYRAVTDNEIHEVLPPGKLMVSPKIDGELWYLVIDEGDPILVSPRGRVISGDVPLLNEFRESHGSEDKEEKPQVFISFASKDMEAADKVVAGLEKAGVHAWYSPRDMSSSGSQFEKQLLESIQTTKGILVLISVNASDSIYVPVEVAKAVEARKKMFVLCLDGSRPEGTLEFYLSHIQWADATGDKFDAALERLAGDIKQTLRPEQTVLAGELFVAKKSGRPRVGDLAALLAGGEDAAVDSLGFCAFDLVSGGDAEGKMPLAKYDDRLAVIERLCKDGKRLKAVTTETVTEKQRVNELFADWVEGGKAEGLVIRASDNRIYKVKPTITVDAAVIAYTERSEDADQARSLLLALIREDGHFQLIGSCGNLGDDANRKKLMQTLKQQHTQSNYRHVSGSGALYQFIRPELVVEVKINDVQSEDAAGGPLEKMVLEHGDNGWRSVRRMPSVSMIHPVLVRTRDDKQVNSVDVRAAQLDDRCFVADIKAEVATTQLPASVIVRREVYTKTTKGVTAVRKLLVWKTNKEEVDPSFPAYVVNWTDYSPGRKDPLKREVRLAPSEQFSQKLAANILEANIKKGWEPAGETLAAPASNSAPADKAKAEPATAKEKPTKKKTAKKKTAKKKTAKKKTAKKTPAKKKTAKANT